MPPVSTVRINGSALRSLRTQRGLTMVQLAAKVGRHPQSIRRLETGSGKLASEVFAHQLANALELETGIGEFTVSGDDDQTEPESAPECEETAA